MSDKKPVLVILTPGFPADESDSTCIPPQQIFVKTLQRNYPEIKVVVLAFQYPYEGEKYLWNGVNVISFNGRNNGNIMRLLTWLKVWQTLKKINKKNNIIGVLSFWLGECALIGKYFGVRNKIKYYTWILGQDAREGNKYYRLVKPNSENLMALSDFIADEFYKNYQVKPAHVIPVGIDTSMFSSGRVERTIDVLGAGSLIPLKQYDVFINIIKSLTGFFPNLNAIICGKGPEKQQLLRQIEALNLQKNIRLTDEISHPEVLALMQQCKIFLHTSSYEGFGAVCAEALYAGAHVVSFCKPMAADIQHWHIAKTNIEMIDIIKEILLNTNIDHKAVLAYSAVDTARSVRNLFAN